MGLFNKLFNTTTQVKATKYYTKPTVRLEHFEYTDFNVQTIYDYIVEIMNNQLNKSEEVTHFLYTTPDEYNALMNTFVHLSKHLEAVKLPIDIKTTKDKEKMAYLLINTTAQSSPCLLLREKTKFTAHYFDKLSETSFKTMSTYLMFDKFNIKNNNGTVLTLIFPYLTGETPNGDCKQILYLIPPSSVFETTASNNSISTSTEEASKTSSGGAFVPLSFGQ